MEYLGKENISWIVAGEKRIDLKKAVEIFADKFNVTPLELEDVQNFKSGAVWLKYKV